MPKQTNLATRKSKLTNHSCKILNMQILPESDMGGEGDGRKDRDGEKEKKLCTYNNQFLAGLPAAVKNCTYTNQTQISVEIHCYPGFDGGLPQYFVLELVSTQTGRVR